MTGSPPAPAGFSDTAHREPTRMPGIPAGAFRIADHVAATGMSPRYRQTTEPVNGRSRSTRRSAGPVTALVTCSAPNTRTTLFRTPSFSTLSARSVTDSGWYVGSPHANDPSTRPVLPGVSSSRAHSAEAGTR